MRSEILALVKKRLDFDDAEFDEDVCAAAHLSRLSDGQEDARVAAPVVLAFALTALKSFTSSSPVGLAHPDPVF